MEGQLNVYGDHRLGTPGNHGVDIATQRADDLDKMAIERVRYLLSGGQSSVRALDVGSASGAQAVRMASAGAAVTALDLYDHSADFSEAAREARVADRCDFVQANIMQFDVASKLGLHDVIVCQRMIHYLAWDDALQVVLQLRDALADEGRLYLSASGLHSELGQDYGHALHGAEQRYCELANEMAEKHAIGGPVCLYSVADLARLLETAGFRVEQVFASAFGNVKAVARVVER